MSSNPVDAQEFPVTGLFDAVDAAISELLVSEPSRRTVVEQKEFLRRTQTLINRLPALLYREVAGLRVQASPAELGDTLQRALADLLRITRGQAKQLVDDAEQLGPRTTLTGEPLEPVLAATAAGVADGTLGAGHVTVIRDFQAGLGDHVSVADRLDAEATLVTKARTQRPDELRKTANDLFLDLDQDGKAPTDPKPRSTKGEVRIGPQRKDGTRTISGRLSPEAAATLEPVFAKWAKPGACNPADESPCVDEVSEEAAARDGRTQPQRNHDALVAVARAMLASGQLGKHHGLPATIIVSVTLAELEARIGLGVTAGGTRVPMLDVLRQARHSYHYLVIYGDHGEVLHLGRTKRIASPSQQIVLFDRDRGCTRPGCTVPGYGCEAHHAVLDWANGGLTNIDDLAFACPSDNKLVTEGGWSTRKNIFGDTEWIPPAHLDVGQPRVNTYHHPQRLRRPRPAAAQPSSPGEPRPVPAPEIVLDPAPTTGPDDPIPYISVPCEPVDMLQQSSGHRLGAENTRDSEESEEPS